MATTQTVEPFTKANLLAADLAGAGVDPNEAQKALAYLRANRDPQRYFAYLRAVTQDGRAVVRSGQTLNYYKDLLAASERHLRGLDADALALTLGWAIRLLRYYKAVPQAARPAAAPPPERRETPPAPEPSATSVPHGPTLPAVGDVFTAKISEMDASTAVIEVPGFTAEQALALLSSDVANLRKYRVGNAARVEVVEVKRQRSGRMLLIVKPGPKP